MVMAKGPLRPVPVSHASPKAVERVLETLDSAGASDSAAKKITLPRKYVMSPANQTTFGRLWAAADDAVKSNRQ